MITATLKRDWQMADISSIPPVAAIVPQGHHELERIPSPDGRPGSWLVLRGTKIGMPEHMWKQWINGILATNPRKPNLGKPIDWEEDEIVLEEDGKLVPPPATS